MLIGCNSLSFATNRSDAEAVLLLAKSGFDSVDYNLNKYSVRDPIADFWNLSQDEHIQYAKSLKATADEAGIVFGQVHSPYPTYFSDKNKLEQVLDITKRSIKIASVLKSPYIVIHPNVPPAAVTDSEVEEAVENNLKYYARLFEDLKRAEICVGIENMFNWNWDLDIPLPTVASTAECMAYMVDSLNNMCGETLFVACLDTGHALLTGGGQPAEMVGVLGQRLKLLHVHDNDGLRDRHHLPFTGVINWEAFITALKRNRYKGILSLEIKTDGTEADSAFNAANKLKIIFEKELLK